MFNTKGSGNLHHCLLLTGTANERSRYVISTYQATACFGPDV
jgi:hypothetical protein